MQILRWLVDRVRFLLMFVGVFVGFVISAVDAEAQSETFVVTNTLNAGTGSLRAAIDDANASTAATKTITFDGVDNGTINLTTDLPEITDGVTINGSTATNLTVEGGGTTTRIFRIGADTTTVRDLGLGGAPLEIGSGASLSFDVRAADQQFDDVIRDAEIDDAGRLIKEGEATLTLRGANTYTGGTLVRAGTLRGDTTSLQGDIENRAIVAFDQADDGEFADAITGTGAVQKTGAGVVTFSGGNTYSGGTTISAGALRGDTSSLQGNIAVESSGSVIFTQAGDGTYAGNLTGAGNFTKRGAGTLTLTGSNTISGQSDLELGALQGSFAGIPQKLSTAAGTLVTFDHDVDGTYAGAISGMADVTKIGTGKLTLSGTNTYAGVTTVSAGTLSANPLKLPNKTTSSIVNNAALIFNSSGTGTYQGVISGAGSLTKAGGGTLRLSRDHTFTGLTSIAAGRLDVDGSLVAGVNVGASGVLGGNDGNIGGAVTVDGTVAPGNSIGELTVNAVTFASGAVFEVEVDEPSGTADHLIVVGDANLGGATVQVIKGAGNYGTPVEVVILTAGAVLDAFAPLEDNSAFLDIDLTQTATTVELRVANNGKTFSDFAQTPNQSTIAAALEAAEAAGTDPDIDTVFESRFELDDPEASPALDSMTGENLTQFATARLATAHRFGRSLDARIRDHQWESNDAFITAATGMGEASGLSVNSMRLESKAIFGVAMLGVGPMGAPNVETGAKADSWARTWIDGYGIYGDVDGNWNESDFDYTIWGGSLGADVLLAEHWVLGLAGGYANTALDFSSRQGDGEVDTYQGALYAGYVDPRFHVGVSGRYAYNDMEGKREIQFVNRKASADLDGNDFGARFEGGVNLLDIGGIVFQPTASVNYNHLTQDDVTESGAMSLNLAIEDSDLDSLVTGVGMRVRGRWKIGKNLWMVPELHGRWLHEFLDTDRLLEASLVSAPGSAFQIQGVELPRDSGSVGFAWSVITNSAWSIVGSYDAILNEDLVQHIGSITLNIEW